MAKALCYKHFSKNLSQVFEKANDFSGFKISFFWFYSVIERRLRGELHPIFWTFYAIIFVYRTSIGVR